MRLNGAVGAIRTANILMDFDPPGKLSQLREEALLPNVARVTHQITIYPVAATMTNPIVRVV